MIKITRPPTTRRGWLELADRCELEAVAGAPAFDGSGFNGVMVTMGPKFYVRRVHERIAAQHGFIVASVRKQAQVTNPLTGELNTLFVIRYERRQ